MTDYISCYHTFYVKDGKERVRTHYDRYPASSEVDAIGKLYQRTLGKIIHHEYTELVVDEVEITQEYINELIERLNSGSLGAHDALIAAIDEA